MGEEAKNKLDFFCKMATLTIADVVGFYAHQVNENESGASLGILGSCSDLEI